MNENLERATFLKNLVTFSYDKFMITHFQS